MLKSMTAFGRASIATPIGRFVAEIQSVNRKFLEINIFLPKEFRRFELDIKKWVGAVVFRGQVTINLSAYFDAIAPISVTPNMPLIRQLVQAWKQIAKELGQKEETANDLSLLAKEEGILIYAENLQDEEQYRDALKEVIHKALESFITMREVEGKALEKDIISRIDLLAGTLEVIKSKSGEATKKYRQKLMERLEEILPGRIENEERILREIALFAEKVDITEEITRFVSHIHQFRQQFVKTGESIGKTLEFLIQEMGREVNTLGSKSMEITISHCVVDMKSELDKIREQIQNIE